MNWNSKILPVRVVGKCGGYESDVIDGLRWAAGLAVASVPANGNPAKVLNVSLSTLGSCSTLLQSAIDEVTALKVPIVVAAGNNGALASSYSPGNCNNVITVGATDRNGGLPAYANTGSTLTVSAPGGDGAGSNAIVTTADSRTTTAANDSVYATSVGTSIAAAHVSGVMSLIASANPTLYAGQVKDILKYTGNAFPNAVSMGSALN